MDAARKSDRLFPCHTTAELIQAVSKGNLPQEQIAKLQLAIRQRNPQNPEFVPVFVVPQL
jgi:hypothetical protein